MTKQQQLAELAARDTTTVSSTEAARILGCDPWGLVLAAKNSTLPIPHFFSGNRLKISKAALLEFCGWKGET